jgi:hypothetical protein
VRSGIPPWRMKSITQRGRTIPSGANRSIALKSSRSGMGGLPQSRRVANVQSKVTMRACAPAFFARSARCRMRSRVPTQYIWKKTCWLAAATSSIGLLANELNPIAVPAAAAARATATSPSGLTAWTPVGEMITGKEMSCPSTLVDWSRCWGRSAICGRNPNSLNAFILSSRVSPCSEPATSAMYTDFGSRFFARRCASATVSNHSLLLAIATPLQR